VFELTDKVAVVTGAASGIGRATANRLAAAGATVVLADLADATGNAAELGGLYVRTDVSDEAQVRELMARAAAARGRIDVVVNNAGIFLPEAAVADVDPADVTRAFDVNAMSVLYGMKHAAPRMPKGGAIVNTASLAGVMGFPTYVAYATAKAAVVEMTKVAAMEYGSAGIRVNCICPSSVDTPMLAAQADGEMEAAVVRTMAPLGCIVRADQVAALIHFLVADDCPVISGQAINIDGGMSGGVSTGMIDAVLAAVSRAGPFASELVSE
jgi:NAD(P)-dependent dehydrogenase (short-subunit alcohol dehydrogenase family)